MCGQDAILTCLQRNEGIGQHIGTGGESIGTEQDAVVADLWFVEQPPAPALGERIAVIKLDLDLRGIDSLLGILIAPPYLETPIPVTPEDGLPLTETGTP